MAYLTTCKTRIHIRMPYFRFYCRPVNKTTLPSHHKNAVYIKFCQPARDRNLSNQEAEKLNFDTWYTPKAIMRVIFPMQSTRSV